MTVLEIIDRLKENDSISRDLSGVECLLAKLHHPELTLKLVHIGGTTGKGSVSAMLYTISDRCEYKAGWFTSSHHCTLQEQIKLDGKTISPEDFQKLGEKVLGLAEEMVAEGMKHPTTQEMMFAMAMAYYSVSRTDLVLVEVGNGGVNDPTNALGVPLVTVLTNMSADLPEEDGNILEDVVLEQIGIVKKGSSVVVYDQEESVMTLVQNLCRSLAVPMVVSKGQRIKMISQSPSGQKLLIDGKPAQMNLVGAHQRRNVSMALETVDLLKERGISFSQNGVNAGFTRTLWMGRFERVLLSPDFILDGCYNLHSVSAMSQTLEELYPHQKFIFLVGVLGHKEYQPMMEKIIGLGQQFITITPHHPEAVSGETLAAFLKEKTTSPVDFASSIEDGVQRVLELATEGDVICAFGSRHILSDVRHTLGLT